MKLLTREELPCEYAERLRDDICARPDYYFQRISVARSEGDLAKYLYDMWAVGREIADAERMGRFSRNPNACSMYDQCEYFDVCTGCASIDDVTLFRTADSPNEELDNTNTKQKDTTHAKTIAECRNPASIEGRRAHHADGGSPPLRMLPLEREDSRPAHGREQDFLAHSRAQPQELRGILHGGRVA